MSALSDVSAPKSQLSCIQWRDPPSARATQLTVQCSERGGIVKAAPERVLLRRELAEHIQPQLTRPPVAAPRAAASSVADGRALAEGVGERDEGWLVREVPLADARKGTTLSGDDERHEQPDQEGQYRGGHGRRSRQAVR
jgi:hypothetical protein